MWLTQGCFGIARHDTIYTRFVPTLSALRDDFATILNSCITDLARPAVRLSRTVHASNSAITATLTFATNYSQF